MGHPRPVPKLLAAKLLMIREYLEVNQTSMQHMLDLPHAARIHEYETGKREPKLEIVLAYGYAAKASMSSICDDRVDLDKFRSQLGTFDIRKEQGIGPAAPTIKAGRQRKANLSGKSTRSI